MTTYQQRRGTTLLWRGRLTPDALDGYTLSARIRWIGGGDDLAVDALPEAPGWVEVTAPADQTADWPLRLGELVVRGVGAEGQVFESEIISIDIQAGVSE